MEPVKESEGISGGIVALIVILILLICALVGGWFIINYIAKTKPDSLVGRKVNAWKAKRALNQE